MKTQTSLLSFALCAMLLFSNLYSSAQCSNPVASPASSFTFSTSSYYTGSPVFNLANYYIPVGVTVTIDGADCICYQGTTFYVLEGGSLIIKNGSTLRSYCADGSWGGIQVIGDPSEDPMTHNQGSVHVLGSTIKNAVIGVRAYEGGVVEANNSVFTNNEIGIKIENQAFNCPFPVLNCDFTVTGNSSTFKQIVLNNVSNAAIQGCNFSNLNYLRGIGIDVTNSNFAVTGSGSVISNSCPVRTTGRMSAFENLATGININAATTGVKYLTVTSSSFTHTKNGLTSSGYVNMNIDGNTFKTENAGKVYTDNNLKIGSAIISGIYITQNVSPIAITNNDFVNSNSADVSINQFTYITNIGYSISESPSLLISKNNFSNYVPYYYNPASIYNTAIGLSRNAAGANSNIYANIFCNNFTDYPLDLYVGALSTYGAYYTIGNVSNPANNLFSSGIMVKGTNARLYYSVENPISDARKLPAIVLSGTNDGTSVVYNADYGMTKNCTRCTAEQNNCADCSIKPVVENNWSLAKSAGGSNEFLLTTTKDPLAQVLKQSELNVFDISGKRVFTGAITDGEVIDLSNLQKGIYIFVITSDEAGPKTGKLIVE